MAASPLQSSFMPRSRWIFLAILGTAIHAAPVRADDASVEAPVVVATGSGPLETSIEVQKLLVNKGPDGATVRQFVDARRLEAGEQLYYTVRVKNPGRTPVTDVVVTKRLPYGVVYVPGSAVGPGCSVELSTDNGVTFARDKGKGATGAFTHVRWTFDRPLAPGATALLRFRAVFL
jgi:uncharacterized repeat protein (TIGR01451 family)